MSASKRKQYRRPSARERFIEMCRTVEVDGVGSDKEVGPFLVAEAATILDLLDPAAGNDGLTWFERANEDEEHEELIAFDERRRMLATLRALLEHAVNLACLASIGAKGVSRRDSWVAAGIRWTDWVGREHHAHCLFCDENLATLGDRRKRKERRIPFALQRKFDKHTQPCAMRYLLRWAIPPTGTDNTKPDKKEGHHDGNEVSA